jgi:apolipoprotein N-acyltransferase
MAGMARDVMLPDLAGTGASQGPGDPVTLTPPAPPTSVTPTESPLLAAAASATPGEAADAPALSRWWALGAAAVAGILLWSAFPPVNVWYAAPVGVALFALATHGRRFWSGVGLGLITGALYLGPMLSWAGGVVGPVWMLLPALEASYIGLLGGAATLVSPVLRRWRWSWPLVTGALWVAQEALRDRTPFGGFPWGRLAFSQGDAPLLRLASLGGAPLVTFGVAALGGLLAWSALGLLRLERTPSLRSGAGGARWTSVIPALVAVALFFCSAVIPVASATDPAGVTRSVQVAVVQGNVPRLGLEFNAQREAVLNNHVEATLELAADVAAGRRPQPDLVVWPENASDVDPLQNADAGARIDDAAAAIGVPILVGGLLYSADYKSVRNVGIVWLPPTATTPGGPAQIYAKRHPVPFGEYIPLRSLAKLVTNKVDLVRTDFASGNTPGVLTVGPARVGDVICFEVAYDDIVRDTVTGGAQLLVTQTNNATFNAAEAAQQLAMVRLRAVEHGRPALMSSTVGISAFVDPDGTVHDATGFNQREVIVRDLELRTTRTMATDVGELPELALVVLAMGALVTGVMLGRRRKAGR